MIALLYIADSWDVTDDEPVGYSDLVVEDIDKVVAVPIFR